MMRILHLITRLIVGGAQENTMLTATLLDKQHFHVEVISGPQTGSEGSLIEEVRQRGIHLTILPSLLRQISPVQDMRALWQLTRVIRQVRYDIVHTHSSKAGILGRMSAWFARTPIIIHTVHGWSFHDHMPRFLKTGYILLERMCAKFTDVLIVVTERDIEKGINAGIGCRQQYRLIRSAIPLEEYNPRDYDRTAIRAELGIPAEAIVIGNVGRFSDQKNPLEWVRVAGEIGRNYPEVIFLLVGDGPLRAEVLSMLDNEGIANRSILTGLRRDVARMMSAMDIFLLTSLWEGLPRVIPQAMRMGLPVVANHADGTSEAIQEGFTGFLCPPGDIKLMAERCAFLIENPGVRRSMAENGQIYSSNEFNLRDMITQIEALYFELAVKKGVQIQS